MGAIAISGHRILHEPIRLLRNIASDMTSEYMEDQPSSSVHLILTKLNEDDEADIGDSRLGQLWRRVSRASLDSCPVRKLMHSS